MQPMGYARAAEAAAAIAQAIDMLRTALGTAQAAA